MTPTTTRAWPWLLVATLAVLGALLAQAVPTTWLDWQPGLWRSEPWRTLTAAWVHLSGRHLLGNLVGAALVAALGVVGGCGGRAALAWALAWPITHLGLLLQPALLHYGGLSGLMHAGVAIAAWQVLRANREGRRWVGAAVLGAMALKLLLEAPWLGPLRHEPGWDIAIAPLAHSTGALAGLLCAWACGVGGDARGPRPPGT